MDQPQPMSWVLSIPVHIAEAQILSTCQCRALSCPHNLESGVLSDPSMDRPCGERNCARGLQRLQTKYRELPSHTGVCQPLPDICVLLHLRLSTALHGHHLSVQKDKGSPAAWKEESPLQASHTRSLGTQGHMPAV